MRLLGQAPRLGQPVWPGAPIGGTVYSPGQQTTTGGAGYTPAPQGTQTTVRVLGPDSAPVPGAAVTVFAVPVHGARQPAGLGQTNGAGVWVFQAAPVSTEAAYRYDVQVSRGGAPYGFPPKETVAIPGRTQTVEIVVCPATIDPLVCEVAEKQRFYKATYRDELQRWNASFAGRQAHAMLRNLPVTDGRLEPYFNEMSWGVADTGIPPQDWPALAKYYAQTKRVLAGIPWPQFSGDAEKIGTYFRRCAMGIPVATGKNGEGLSILNFRLYAPTYSDFFPRNDKKLREALAAAWAVNMGGIFACIDHRIRKKARETERGMKQMSLIGLVTAFALGASFGLQPSTFAVLIASEAVDHYRLSQADIGADVADALPKAAGLLSQPGLTVDVALVGLLSIVLTAYAENADISPVTKALIKNGLPLAVDTLVDNTLAGAEAVAGISAPQAADAITAAVVKLIAGTIRKEGIKDAKQLGRMVMGYQTGLEAALIPFQLWLLRTLSLGTIVEEAAREAGIGFDAEADMYGPAEEAAAAAGGVVIPVSATAPGAADTPGPVAESALEGIAAAGAGVLLLGAIGVVAFGS